MNSLSECTSEEVRVYWLYNAQFWMKQSETWLGYDDLEDDDTIEALRCFVRAVERIAWAYEDV